MKKGFSPLELIVVIAIIGIMTAVSFVSLNSVRQRKAVETDARKVTAVIREAQNNAFSGKKADVCNRWTVSYSNGSNIFSLIGSGIGCSGQNYQYNLDGGNAFSNDGSINFEVPFGEVTATQKTTLCNSGGAECYTICVNSASNIQEMYGAAAAVTCP